MFSKAAVVIVSACADRSLALETALNHDGAGPLILKAADRRSALRLLATHEVAVLMSDIRVRDGGWKDFLSDTARMSRPPRLVVTAASANALPWAEVLNLGGYDVLVEPLNADEIRKVAASAMRAFAGAHESAVRKPAGSEKMAGQARCTDFEYGVLIIDSDRRSRGALESAVRAKGFHPLLAVDGAQALALVQQHAPSISLVIADWETPGMRCDELCDRVLTLNGDMKFVVSTRQPLREVKRQFKSYATPEFLPKPLTPSALFHLLHTVRAA